MQPSYLRAARCTDRWYQTHFNISARPGIHIEKGDLETNLFRNEAPEECAEEEGGSSVGLADQAVKLEHHRPLRTCPQHVISWPPCSQHVHACMHARMRGAILCVCFGMSRCVIAPLTSKHQLFIDDV